MSKSLLNRMKENPVPAAIGIAIVLGVIAFLIWYFFFREKKDQVGPGATGNVKPSITFGESAMILNPDSENVETYKIEYATENLGKNIDISINWKNGAGFEQSGVDSIVVKRKKGTTYINVEDGSTTKTITEAEFLTDFADCKVDILGDFIGSTDVVGDNVIEVYYTTTKSDTLVSLGKVTVTIEQNHLDTTIDLSSVTSITIPPTRGGDITSLLGVPDYTVFSIMSVYSYRTIADSVRFEQLTGSVKLKDVDGTQVMLDGRTPAETYVFEKYLDTNYFIRPSGETGKYFVDNGTSLVLTDRDEIFKTQESLNQALFDIIEGEPVFPSSYMYVPNVLKIPSGGFGSMYNLGGEQYMSSIDCEMRCSEDDECMAAMYSDTVNHNVNDNACKGVKAGTGSKTFSTHNHYSTLVKESFEQGVVENPKFVDGKAVVAGTPWAGTTGWETSHSSSAHGTVYLSWHPFSKNGGKMWASWSNDPDCFVAIKYPREVALKGYVVASKSDANNYTPAKVIIEGSNDGTTWTKIKESTTPNPSRVVGYSKDRTSIIAREKLGSNTIKYSRYRARIPDSNGHYNNLVEIILYTTLN